jgi:hypothetical protein
MAGYAGFWLIAGEIHISTIAVHPDGARPRPGRVAAAESPAGWRGRSIRFSSPWKCGAATKQWPRRSIANTASRKWACASRYYHDTGEDAVLMTVDFARATGLRSPGWANRRE